MLQSEPAYDTGLARRDAALKQVISGNKAWRDSAIASVKALPVGWKGTGEDIRAVVKEAPHHHNAWGALVVALLKAELIYPTGDYKPMVEKTSHGRKTPVYERM